MVSRDRARHVGWLALAVPRRLVVIPDVTDIYQAARSSRTRLAKRDADSGPR